jgi:GNAT superfamily N-acetyltransferase
LNLRVDEILCRPAQPADTKTVQSFLPGIWNGEDYVPQVWDAWLRSREGSLVVAEYAGQTAGLGRLRDLGWGEWWMEGLRVDPQFQGLGIASRLHEYLLERWYESSGSVVRLATHARRQAVRHLCQRTGFQEIARLGCLLAAPQSSDHSFVRGMKVSLPSGQAQQQRVLSATRGQILMDLNWAWAALREERIRERSASSLWTWRGGTGWVVLLQDPDEGGEDLLLQACSIPEGQRYEFFSELRGLASQLGCSGLRVFVPFELAHEEFWTAAGWSRDEDEELLLFERLK